MKNKFFDKNLFVEGLLQLKTIGVVTTILSVVIACITPLIYLSDDGVSSVSIYAVNPFIYFISYLIAPIMAIMLFSFLFKRNKSDFYHSIPQKRTAIYFSFALSIAVWVIFELLISMTTALGGAFLVKQYYITSLADVLPLLLNLISTALLFISAVLLGASVTGRLFASLAVTGMILVYPRFCYTCYCAVMIGTVSKIDGTHFIPTYLSNYNSLFFNYTDIYSFVYTLILSLIILIIGAVFFKKRKSQTAERSSSSPRAQTVIRVLISMCFCVPAVCLIFSKAFGYLNFNNYSESYTYTLIVILYIFAFILYFIYEILSTKSTKNILKAVKDIGYVITANVLAFAVLTGSALVIGSYSPSAEKVDSIEILGIYDYEYDEYDIGTVLFGDSFYSYIDNNYIPAENILPNLPIEITGSAGIKTVCDNYNRKKDENNYIVKCKFNQGSSKYRDIVLTQEDISSFASSIKIDREKLNLKIKSVNNPTKFEIYDEQSGITEDAFSDKTALQQQEILKSIFNTALEELSTMGDEDLAKIYLYMNYDGSFTRDYINDSSAVFIIEFSDNGKKYQLPIYPAMKKTVSAFVKSTDSLEHQNTYRKFLSQLAKESITEKHYCFYALNSSNAGSCEYRIKKGYQQELCRKLLTYSDLKSAKNADDIVISVTDGYTDEDDFFVGSDQAYIVISKSDFEKYFTERYY